ncbi:hypothetical protein BX667DRAFT_358279 [Coemansia mojavensis]|nr:hypothetical protein BX667DRAFT_358279 [Coemansia mojavensis]
MEDVEESGMQQAIKRLSALLCDTQIQSMDIVPTACEAASSNQYPFFVESGCLGVPIAVVPAMLKCAWASLQQCIEPPTADNAVLPPAASATACMLTRCIVALNPEHHTAWNWRKRLIEQHQISSSDELRLLDLLVTYKRSCKSGLLWYHRKAYRPAVHGS